MEVTVEASALVSALKRANGVTKKSTNAALASVLINTTGAGLSVTAFDTEVALVSELSASVRKAGSVLLSKETFEYVQALRGPITLRKAGGYIAVENGRSSARFGQVAQPEDFPRLPTPTVPLEALNSPGLLNMLRRVPHACASDYSRPAMAGVYLYAQEGAGHVMAATDGLRIATLTRQLGAVHLPKEGIVLPSTAVVKMRQLLEEGAEGWRFGAAGGFAVLQREGLSFLTKLIDSAFPDYTRVTSMERTTIQVPRAGLLVSLDRVALAGKEVSLIVEDGGRIRFESRNEKSGNEGADELQVRKQRVTPRRAWFRYGLLRDALVGAEGEEVLISVPPRDNTKGVPAFVLTPGDDGYLAGVMPLSHRERDQAPAVEG